jgi:hypothetical protein
VGADRFQAPISVHGRNPIPSGILDRFYRTCGPVGSLTAIINSESLSTVKDGSIRVQVRIFTPTLQHLRIGTTENARAAGGFSFEIE